MTCSPTPLASSSTTAGFFAAALCQAEPVSVVAPFETLRLVLVLGACQHLVALSLPADDVAPVVLDAARDGRAPRVTYDQDCDMGYVYLAWSSPTRIADQAISDDGRFVIDLDPHGRLVGIEIFAAGEVLCPSVQAAGSEALSELVAAITDIE
jgi:uncharacterized protein YuzE